MPGPDLARIAQELIDGPDAVAAPSPPAPAALDAVVPRQAGDTMGRLQKVRYTHEAMIDLIITTPMISQGELARYFGYTQAWISNILASDAFQAKLAERRKEVIDPAMIATIEERFRGLTIQSLNVLQKALDQPVVKPEVALRAAELGAKALGVGGHAPPASKPIDLDALAERIRGLNPGPRDIPGEVISKEMH